MSEGPESGEQNVTVLLHAWRSGDTEAYGQLISVVYPKLCAMAARCLRGERSGNTMNATSLVHEAYLKILGTDLPWVDRVHFFAVSARVMRQILVDHARAHGREKRGGAVVKISLDDAAVISPTPEARLLDLDEALQNLAVVDQRKADLVGRCCRFPTPPYSGTSKLRKRGCTAR